MPGPSKQAITRQLREAHLVLPPTRNFVCATRAALTMPACLFLVLPMTSALLRPRPAPVCMPTRHVQRTRTLLPQADRVRRTRQLFVAQLADWTPRVDEVSGATYYYNEQTGQSQWASPQATAAQQDYGDQAAWQPPQGSGRQGSSPQDADQVLWRFNGRRLCSGGRYSLHSSMVKQAAHVTICRSRSPSACSGPRWRPDTPRCRGESCGSGALPPGPKVADSAAFEHAGAGTTWPC